MTRPRALVTSGIVLIACAGAVFGQEPAPTTPEEFVGVLHDVTGNFRRQNVTWFTLHVDSYSPPEEVKNLADLLKEKGQDAVLSALWKMKDRGWIRVGESLGYGVPVIFSNPTASGRRVVVLTDRPIQLYERWQGLRSLDYPFGVITLDLNKDGKGKGELIAAGRANIMANTIEVENYEIQPYQILNVRTEHKGGKKGP